MSDRKTAIVTGAGSGIGKATALRLAKDGYNIVVNGRGGDKLGEVVAMIGKDHAVAAPGDVSKKSDAERVIKTAMDTFGRIDVLVNNAGVVLPGTADTLEDKDFEAMMAINVGGVRIMTLAALPHLRKTKGNVVNVSSVSGMRADWGMYGYNASKGAVSLMTLGMALDLGHEQVRVNAVAPATTNTPIAAGLKENKPVSDALARRIPIGRVIEPEEVAAAISFLAGPDARAITGVILPVDGGLTASNGQPNFAAP